VNGGNISLKTVTNNDAMRMRYVAYLLVFYSIVLYWYIFRVQATQLQSTSLKNAWTCTVDGYLRGLCRNNQIRSFALLVRTKLGILFVAKSEGRFCSPIKFKFILGTYTLSLILY